MEDGRTTGGLPPGAAMSRKVGGRKRPSPDKRHGRFGVRKGNAVEDRRSSQGQARGDGLGPAPRDKPAPPVFLGLAGRPDAKARISGAASSQPDVILELYQYSDNQRLWILHWSHTSHHAGLFASGPLPRQPRGPAARWPAATGRPARRADGSQGRACRLPLPPHPKQAPARSSPPAPATPPSPRSSARPARSSGPSPAPRNAGKDRIHQLLVAGGGAGQLAHHFGFGGVDGAVAVSGFAVHGNAGRT